MLYCRVLLFLYLKNKMRNIYKNWIFKFNYFDVYMKYFFGVLFLIFLCYNITIISFGETKRKVGLYVVLKNKIFQVGVGRYIGAFAGWRTGRI